MNTDLLKFKKVLEYFIAHQNYIQSNSNSVRGYDDYIKPHIDKGSFCKTGQGYKNDNIQRQIIEWEDICSHRICINVQPNFGDYTSKKSYLNWYGTGLNIFSEWENNEVVALSIGYAYWWKKPTVYKIKSRNTIKELNLFEDNSNDVILEDFYNKFIREITDYENKQGEYYLMENNEIMTQQNNVNVGLLRANHNLILTGAPGTGKTYLAKQIAKAMGCTDDEIGFVQFHPSYDYTDFVEGLRPIQDGDGNVGFERKDGVFKEFCAKALERFDTNNFDNSWTSFINEVMENGNMMELKTPTGTTFSVSVNQRKNLTFYTGTDKKVGGSLTRKGVKSEYEGNPYYKYWLGYYNGVIEYIKEKHNLGDITKTKHKDFVFIIDEINRGEISKIFGELFYAIDPGYRVDTSKIATNKPVTIKTQYANMEIEPNEFDIALGIVDKDDFGHFFVPENVYIIGTMNDIDRSVESMDFAFRRRFAFKEIKAENTQSMLDGLEWKGEAIRRMNRLNAAISNIEGLSSAYHIGASYFLKLENYNGDFGKLWEYHLEGLLREYLRGMQYVEEKIKELKVVYDNESDSDNGQQQ